jgi:hypothetical protein
MRLGTFEPQDEAVSTAYDRAAACLKELSEGERLQGNVCVIVQQRCCLPAADVEVETSDFHALRNP